MPADPDQLIHHENKRGIVPFEIGGQQGKQAPGGWIAEEMPESGQQAADVDLLVKNIMPARLKPGGAAGFEYPDWLSRTRYDLVGFEKLNRQKRDPADGIHPGRINFKKFKVTLVNSIFLSLKPKDFKGGVGKC